MLCSGCLPSFYQVAVFSLESSVRLVAHLPFYSSYILNLWIHEFMSDFLSFQSVSEIFPTHKYVGIHTSQQWQHRASWIKKIKSKHFFELFLEYQ